MSTDLTTLPTRTTGSLGVEKSNAYPTVDHTHEVDCDEFNRVADWTVETAGAVGVERAIALGSLTAEPAAGSLRERAEWGGGDIATTFVWADHFYPTTTASHFDTDYWTLTTGTPSVSTTLAGGVALFALDSGAGQTLTGPPALVDGKHFPIFRFRFYLTEKASLPDWQIMLTDGDGTPLTVGLRHCTHSGDTGLWFWTEDGAGNIAHSLALAAASITINTWYTVECRTEDWSDIGGGSGTTWRLRLSDGTTVTEFASDDIPNFPDGIMYPVINVAAGACAGDTLGVDYVHITQDLTLT